MNRVRFRSRCPLAQNAGGLDGSDGALREESLREATTNSESRYVACPRRAQSHAASLPPSIASRCRSSQSQTAQTVSLASYKHHLLESRLISDGVASTY